MTTTLNMLILILNKDVHGIDDSVRALSKVVAVREVIMLTASRSNFGKMTLSCQSKSVTWVATENSKGHIIVSQTKRKASMAVTLESGSAEEIVMRKCWANGIIYLSKRKLLTCPVEITLDGPHGSYILSSKNVNAAIPRLTSVSFYSNGAVERIIPNF